MLTHKALMKTGLSYQILWSDFIIMHLSRDVESLMTMTIVIFYLSYCWTRLNIKYPVQ